MRFFTGIIIRFYAAVLILIGVVVIVFSLNLLPLQSIDELLAYILSNLNSRIITGLSGLLLIVISTFFAQLVLGIIRDADHRGTAVSAEPLVAFGIAQVLRELEF